MSHKRKVEEVHESCSGKYSTQLVDQDNDAISIEDVTALTLTLYDSASQDIINSRDAQNVLNTNDCALDCDGTLTWNWTADDMPLLGTKDSEIHIALFDVTWDSGTKHMSHDIAFRVIKVDRPA